MENQKSIHLHLFYCFYKNNSSNDNEFNIVGKSNLASVHELISTYGMEAMPQAMEILLNEERLIERGGFDRTRMDGNL